MRHLQIILSDKDSDMLKHLRQIKEAEDSQLNASRLVRNLLWKYYEEAKAIRPKIKGD